MSITQILEKLRSLYDTLATVLSEATVSPETMTPSLGFMIALTINLAVQCIGARWQFFRS